MYLATCAGVSGSVVRVPQLVSAAGLSVYCTSSCQRLPASPTVPLVEAKAKLSRDTL
jgi:hypothetical protein